MKTLEFALTLFLLIQLASCGGGEVSGNETHQDSLAITSTSKGRVNFELPAPRHALSLPSPSGILDASALMDWAELNYPEYFPGHKANQYLDPYVLRYYKETNTYLGVDGIYIRVLGPAFGKEIVTVGTLDQYACKVLPQYCSTIPAAKPVNEQYYCDDREYVGASKCATSVYPLRWSLNPVVLNQYLQSSSDHAYSSQSSRLSCKRSSACISEFPGATFAEVQAIKRASTAVVRVTTTSDWTWTGTEMGYGLVSSCTGTVIQNNLDSKIYIVTAAHCLYQDGNFYYPNARFGTYRARGLPLYVTFNFEKTSCSGSSKAEAFGGYTIAAEPVAYLYSLNGWSSPTFNSALGEITDFALLQVTSSLPPGVQPIALSSKALLPSERIYTYSHPFGTDKSGGIFDNGVVIGKSSGYQYLVGSSSRLTEPGSSGGPLFAYDPNNNKVTLKGIQGGAQDSEICSSPQISIFGRLDRHAPFLSAYVGPI